MIRSTMSPAAPAPTGVLVDTNVLLDILSEDPAWFEWSAGALSEAADRNRLVINQIIFAELSVQFPTVEAMDDALPGDRYDRESLPWDAGFIAGKVFHAYRRRGGARRSPLPDFYIGAHAAVRGYALLTRDAARYRSYFPRLTIIAPDST